MAAPAVLEATVVQRARMPLAPAPVAMDITAEKAAMVATEVLAAEAVAVRAATLGRPRR